MMMNQQSAIGLVVVDRVTVHALLFVTGMGVMCRRAAIAAVESRVAALSVDVEAPAVESSAPPPSWQDQLDDAVALAVSKVLPLLSYFVVRSTDCVCGTVTCVACEQALAPMQVTLEAMKASQHRSDNQTTELMTSVSESRNTIQDLVRGFADLKTAQKSLVTEVQASSPSAAKTCATSCCVLLLTVGCWLLKLMLVVLCAEPRRRC